MSIIYGIFPFQITFIKKKKITKNISVYWGYPGGFLAFLYFLHPVHNMFVWKWHGKSLLDLGKYVNDLELAR